MSEKQSALRRLVDQAVFAASLPRLHPDPGQKGELDARREADEAAAELAAKDEALKALREKGRKDMWCPLCGEAWGSEWSEDGTTKIFEFHLSGCRLLTAWTLGEKVLP